jgi:hypothetical protein
VFKDNHLVGIGKREYRHAVDRAETETEGVPKINLPWGRTH